MYEVTVSLAIKINFRVSDKVVKVNTVESASVSVVVKAESEWQAELVAGRYAEDNLFQKGFVVLRSRARKLSYNEELAIKHASLD